MIKFLNNIEEHIVFLLMAIISILVFMQVVFRYLISIPMPWIEELLRVCFIWLIMLSGAIGVKRKANLGVTMLVARLPLIPKAIVFHFGVLVTIFTCGLFIYSTIEIIGMQKEMSQRLITMPIPIHYSTLALPVGFLLIAVRSFQQSLKAREGGYF